MFLFWSDNDLIVCSFPISCISWFLACVFAPTSPNSSFLICFLSFAFFRGFCLSVPQQTWSSLHLEILFRQCHFVHFSVFADCFLVVDLLFINLLLRCRTAVWKGGCGASPSATKRMNRWKKMLPLNPSLLIFLLNICLFLLFQMSLANTKQS